MAIFGNFKGTTQSEFQIGKTSEGSKISSGTLPDSGISNGDIYIDSSNSTLQVYNNAWVSVGSTLADLNVDSGTLFVDSSNDTVSVGSTSSNDKLFVNGSLRLGTNPTLKFSGAYLDVTHSNGTATQLRVRDNGSGSDPIFKVYNASNNAEVFKVQGSTTTVTGDINVSTSNQNALVLDSTNNDGPVTVFKNSGTETGYIGNSEALITNGGTANFGIRAQGHLTLSANGNNETFKISSTETIVTGNVVPSANVTYDLGTDTARWKDLYLSGNTIKLGTTAISVTSDNEIDFSDTANSSVKRKLVVDEIELGSGSDKIVLRKGSDGKFESKAKNRSTKAESSVKVDLDDNDTDDLSEGSTNIYFTTARANSAIDAKLTGDITLGNVTSQSTNTGVVEGVVFQPITDYGSITNSANITIDYGAVNEAGIVPAIGDFEYLNDIFGPTGDSFTVASLPSAAQPGQMIYVSDETGGSVMAFSDGSNWRRITDRAVVS